MHEYQESKFQGVQLFSIFFRHFATVFNLNKFCCFGEIRDILLIILCHVSKIYFANHAEFIAMPFIS